jgi:hypothetical protein
MPNILDLDKFLSETGYRGLKGVAIAFGKNMGIPEILKVAQHKGVVVANSSLNTEDLKKLNGNPDIAIFAKHGQAMAKREYLRKIGLEKTPIVEIPEQGLRSYGMSRDVSLIHNNKVIPDPNREGKFKLESSQAFNALSNFINENKAGNMKIYPFAPVPKGFTATRGQHVALNYPDKLITTVTQQTYTSTPEVKKNDVPQKRGTDEESDQYNPFND